MTGSSLFQIGGLVTQTHSSGRAVGKDHQPPRISTDAHEMFSRIGVKGIGERTTQLGKRMRMAVDCNERISGYAPIQTTETIFRIIGH